jgi:pyruvate-ferredoxin/flavodoxin oxidoreductase
LRPRRHLRRARHRLDHDHGQGRPAGRRPGPHPAPRHRAFAHPRHEHHGRLPHHPPGAHLLQARVRPDPRVPRRARRHHRLPHRSPARPLWTHPPPRPQDDGPGQPHPARPGAESGTLHAGHRRPAQQLRRADPQFLEDAYKDFGELTGRHYGLLSQYKTDDTDTVFVSLGSAAENIEAAVDYLRETRGVTVGSIHVNVIRPFPEAAIVAALKGKKNVIILERTDEALSGDNPLGRDIRTALSKAIQTEGRPAAEGLPTLSSTKSPRSTPAPTASARATSAPSTSSAPTSSPPPAAPARTARPLADGVNFIVLGIDHPYAVVGDETPSLLPEGAVAVRFHSIGGWGAITTGKNLGAIIGDLNDLLYERDGLKDDFGNPKEVIHVSANPKYGSEKKGAPTSYFMVAAKDRIRVNCDLRHVTVVLCCDPKAFTHTNPLDGMAGRRLAGLGIGRGRRAGLGTCPMWARKQIIDKNIRVFTLPGFAIAKKATDRGDLQLRMQGNAFLGAFFAVSSLLEEFGITQEQYREVVYKQYVKKFGKLGDAVVQSNMEVMMQGFEQVKEIKIGALAAADRSSLRGQALLPILELATAGGSCGPAAVPHPFPPARARALPSAPSPSSTPSSAPPTATTSPPRRSAPWASSPRPPATPPPST